MPKKDGTPTAAERRDTERIADNERFISTASDEDLLMVRSWNSHDDEWSLAIDTELARRKSS